MADQEPLYSAEQIAVPDALPQILKDWTKEVIRASPQDIIAFSADYFARKLEEKKVASGGSGGAKAGAGGH